MSAKTDALKKEQEFILQSGDARRAYYFARDNYEYPIDIQRLSEFVGNSHDVSAALNFATNKNIRGADIPALQRVILQYGTALDAKNFAKVPCADIKALEEKIIKAKGTTAQIVLDFLKMDYDKDINGLCRKILTCKDANAYYALQFIYYTGYFPTDMVDMVGDYLIKEYNGQSWVMQKGHFSEKEYKERYNNAELLNSFVKYLESQPNFNLDKYQDAVIEKGTAEDAYKFAKNIAGADIKKLASVAVKEDNAEYALRFAKLLDLNIVGLLDQYIKEGQAPEQLPTKAARVKP